MPSVCSSSLRPGRRTPTSPGRPPHPRFALPWVDRSLSLYWWSRFCIQGWSGVAKWGGVPMRTLLEMAQPSSEAKYVVFYSFGEGGEGGLYYDVHTVENMRDELSLLAYEMNGEPLHELHGAPLRLRCENELGFKNVKWVRAIEFVTDF